MAGPWLVMLLQFVMELREGSTVGRASLYTYSLGQLKGVDWVLGVGLRPREESLEFPVGSHSTYLSFIFKTGMAGFMTLIAFQLSLFSRWYKLRSLVQKDRTALILWRGFGIIFMTMAFWMFSEDIDAPQFLAFLYFSYIGIFEGFRRGLKYEALPARTV